MKFPFLAEFDRDLQESLLQKLRVVWTHGSTALEGNTLTAGETLEVLSQGLTISGKPLSDHNEVVGHNRAIDLVFELCDQDRPIDEKDLFSLHKAVQTRVVMDIYQPVGSWKLEPNSAAVVIDGEVLTNDTYAHPRDVPQLMKDWLAMLNAPCLDAIETYAQLHATFVRIHPFADGNGRLARLLANIPLLKAGFPPITIPVAERTRYIETLAKWQLGMGPISKTGDLTGDLDEFTKFCRDCWKEIEGLISETRQRQKERES